VKTLYQLDSYLLEHTRGLRIVLLLALLGLALSLGRVWGAEPGPVVKEIHPPMTDAAALGQRVPPLASFGVMQCGEVVAIWVILQDKSVLRTDAMHHPDTPEEYRAFLHWLTTAQSDIYEIPCPAAHAAP
jgi:hypothetical protein